MKLPPDGEAVTQALESATERLVELDPAELASGERILTERGLAVRKFVHWLETHQQRHDPELATRLQQIFDAGAAAALRFAIIRHDTVFELSHLNSELALLKALAGPKDSPSSALDCNG